MKIFSCVLMMDCAIWCQLVSYGGNEISEEKFIACVIFNGTVSYLKTA